MLLLCILLTGLAGIFIYPTVFFGHRLPEMGYLAWFFLVPLLYCQFKNSKKLFIKSFTAAFIFYAGSLYWLVNAMTNFGGLGFYESVGVLLLIVVILSLYWATSNWLAHKISIYLPIPFFVSFTILMVTMDFCRTYFPVGGFPWAMPAYSQGSFLQYFEWVDVTGMYGLNLLIYLINALLADILFHVFEKRREGMVVRAVVLLVIVVFSVFLNLARKASTFDDVAQNDNGVLTALVQGNISQDMKWNVRVAKENVDEHLKLTEKATEEGAELAIWPETAYPFTVNLKDDTDFPYLFWRGRTVLPMPLYVGAVSIQEDGVAQLVYNSSFYLDTKAQIKSIYHKRHLVPFGEYIPFKEYLSFARRLTVAVGDFTPGKEPVVVEHGRLKLGALICYEDIFPDLARSQTRAGSNVLANLTNDAWYGNTSAPYQHLVFSQMRALENRRYLLRATNTGLTAVINPHGMVEATLPPFEAGYLVRAVYPIEKMSTYTLYGDWVAWVCFALAGSSVIAIVIRRIVGR
ncbi:apolipoprotein N-acyltransferase [bacterium]|nr:apolipoprotein N-acyltransferase [bacterium]